MEPLSIRDSHINGLVLQGELRYAHLDNSLFQNCNFDTASFVNANISNNIFTNCNFTTTNFKYTIIHGCRFENCTRLNFHGSRNVQMVDCLFNGSRDLAEDLFKKLVELMP